MSDHMTGVRQRTIGLMFGLMVVGLLIPAVARADIAYAVTQSNTLIRFDPSTPGTVTTIGPITTSPTAGVQILSIDFRPSDAILFGIGSDGHVYEINTVTAKARLPVTFGGVTTPNPIAGSLGADFDPITGLLRVVSDTDANFRMGIEGARLTDTTLSPASDISAVAYSRNFAETDHHTLFGIDHGSNSLVRIGDADSTETSQSLGAVHVIGPLGVDPAEDIGFDITVNPETAYATMGATGDPQSTLYRIDLQTGAATARGVVAAGERVRALAVFSRPAIIYVLTLNNEIVTVRSTALGTTLNVVPLTPRTQVVRAIDVHPWSGVLYGVTESDRLVTIDPRSGFVRELAPITGVTLIGTPVSIDINPVTGRLHMFTQAGQHVAVDTAVSVGSAVMLPRAASAGDVTSIAFTNNHMPAATTTLLGLQTTLSQFGRIDNLTTTGDFVPIGPLGVNAVSPSAIDVSGVDNTIFATVRPTPLGPTTLYVIDPTTGAASSVGAFPVALAVEDIAIGGISLFNFTGGVLHEIEWPETSGASQMPITIVRSGDLLEPASVTLSLAAGGTATDGADFSSVDLPATLHFASGERLKTFYLTIFSDTIEEPDETINLALTAAEGGGTLFLGSTSGTVLIIDDDHPLPAGNIPTVRITDPTDQPTFAWTAPFITISGQAQDADGVLALHPIQSVTWMTNRGATGTAFLGPQDVAGNDNSRVAFTAEDVPLGPGVNVIKVTATDVQGHTSFATLVVIVDGLQYVLAEGAISAFFDTDLLIANPNTQVAPVKIEYLLPGGGKVTQQTSLGARSHKTIAVNGVPELAGVGEVSMVLTADPTLPLAVERTMRWGAGRYGAHTDKATDSARTAWYFAEGSQGFFFTYVLLANPNPFPIKARVDFLVEGATSTPAPPGPILTPPPPRWDYTLAPFSRFTVDAGANPNLVNTSFGIQVVFDQPGVAERAMYFGTNPLWVGGHESAGAPSPSHEWFLAEGATGSFFSTFILLANPSVDAKVDMTFFPADGSPVHKPQFTLRSGQRLTLNIADQDPSLVDAAVATRVVSDSPIVVERAQYWPNPPQNWYEAHNAFGVTGLSKTWALAEGRVGGSEGYQTYILLANPGTTAADVTLTFLRESGAAVTKTVSVPAGRRFNVQIDGSTGGDLHDENFGALITSTEPIAVERAMYGNSLGQTWQTGTDAVGTRLPFLVTTP